MDNTELKYDEAMKTFIPEYVECTATSTNAFTKNKIYKIENFNNNQNFNIIDNDNDLRDVIMNGGLWSFKPSTKEAYDAQFVVKEPAENKTELEIWLENTKSLNLSLDVLTDYIENPLTCDFDNIFKKLEGYMSKDKANILFNKWNDQVIEPLPQFKIIESIETITKVENNEGNQFFIGDEVISSKTKIKSKIISFKYNVDKTAILAITDKRPNIGIGINHLEHYIAPKIEVEETLLEKAKRLYPVGTKFIARNTSKECIITTGIFQQNSMDYEFINEIDNTGNDIQTSYIYHCIYSKDKWAKIIE